MTYQLPEYCLRNRTDCQPLSQREADDGTSFFCCGANDGSTRTVPADIFRLCFKNSEVDEISDNDSVDLLDMIHVVSDAMATHRRLGV